MDKRTIGLYEKFRVERTDGTSAPGEKHDGCQYFVLDVTHDPFAIPALKAYIAACRPAYPALATDLDHLLHPQTRQPGESFDD
jgi:hypothetical protein